MTRRDASSPRSTTCGGVFIAEGYSEIILPSIWEQAPFVEKAGEEILDQMYAFGDKRGRPVCLIPEATAIVRQLYWSGWDKSRPKPIRLFYVARCYRYERPQSGRYREFTQFGVELLGGSAPDDREEILRVLRKVMCGSGVPYTLSPSVKRGLDYYTEDGFEVECECLDAQRQVAGGGRYDCGIGFAVGVDRLMLAKSRC